MEIRQLQYFVASVEERSFYKAGAKLFTSQPAISKSIAQLEKELNQVLLERGTHGLKVTVAGEKVYNHAKNVLRQINILENSLEDTVDNRLTLASYPSLLISTALADFYVAAQSKLEIEYHEGTVQDIISLVNRGVCELGLLYISPFQQVNLRHILGHKHLEFVPIKECNMCLYVGKKHPLYNKNKSIKNQALTEQQYIRGIKDFFSVEHHFDFLTLNHLNTAQFPAKVLTNSDHFVLQMLAKTDLCELSIDTKGTKHCHKVNIDAEEKSLTIGYVKLEGAPLSSLGQEFIAWVEKYI